MAGVLQGSVLGPLLFFTYVMIFGKILSKISDFLHMMVFYIYNILHNDMANLQIDLKRLGEWAFENDMIINPAGHLFHESPSDGVAILFIRGHSNSESEQL
jgi:hypothetical protein